jgi:hypothetical protein
VFGSKEAMTLMMPNWFSVTFFISANKGALSLKLQRLQSCSKVHCFGFFSGRQRRNFVP